MTPNRKPQGKLLTQTDCVCATQVTFHQAFACETVLAGGLTCLERGCVVGCVFARVRDGGDRDQIELAAFQHGYLAAGRRGRAAQRGSVAVHGCGPV